ncbi:hypothetical protein BDQ17DRAFT_1349559 [Cyathus striatus]|nr:hypothetical protein BDQ17DRAFT_1349559 [Cyathus striatus]
MAPHDAPTMDSLLQILTTSNNIQALAHTLRGIPRETSSLVWASPLSSGQDPLDVLDVRANTLGVLYILCARLSVSGALPPRWEVLEEFCHNYDVEQARAAPDRVLALAKAIQKATYEAGVPQQALPLLIPLLHIYPSSTLTPMHPLILQTSLTTRVFPPVLPLLSPNTISDISGDINVIDVLTYFYLGGMILACVQRWEEAEDMMEYVILVPGYPSAIQLEAVKKHRLFGLIVRGKPNPLPKPTHPLLPRLLKQTPYAALISAYPSYPVLQSLLQQHHQLFAQEKNLGLVKKVVDLAKVWSVKKLTGTYVTLGLEEIGRVVVGEGEGVEGEGQEAMGEEEVRELILSMIDQNILHAQFTTPTTVSFSDPPPAFSKADVDRVLRDVQGQAEMLALLDGEVGCGREFLSKVVKNQQSDGSWGGASGGAGATGVGGQGVLVGDDDVGPSWEEFGGL